MPAKGYKMTPQKKEVYLQHLRDGLRRGEAARAVGVTRNCIKNHAHADAEFAAAICEAELDANETVENALFKAACDGNVTAIQVWLYNRCPDRWSDKRKTQITGDMSHKIEDAKPEDIRNRLLAFTGFRGESNGTHTTNGHHNGNGKTA